jgi:hypothetical protein
MMSMLIVEGWGDTWVDSVRGVRRVLQDEQGIDFVAMVWNHGTIASSAACRGW